MTRLAALIRADLAAQGFAPFIGTSEEFATLAVELVTNSYMNAESIRVDGGVRMQPK